MNLKEARKQAGKTMQDMADELGIARQTYSKMEKDASLVSIADAQHIAAFLGHDLSEIFFGTDCS